MPAAPSGSPAVHRTSIARKLAVSVLMGIVVATLLFLLSLALHAPITPASVRLALQDHAQELADSLYGGRPARGAPIRVIDMAPTQRGEPAISRAAVAHLVSKLDGARAAVIVLDFDLTNTSPADADLATSLDSLKHAQVVLAIRPTPRPSGQCSARTTPGTRAAGGANQIYWPSGALSLARRNVWFGSIESEADIDGVARAICPFTTAWSIAPGARQSEQVAIPSIALLAAILAKNGADVPERWHRAIGSANPRPGLSLLAEKSLEADDFDARRIHFIASDAVEAVGRNARVVAAQGVNRFPYELVTDDGADLSDLAGAIVVVGAAGRETPDRNFTPLGMMSGLMVMTNAIAAAERDDFLREPPSHLLDFAVELVFVIGGCCLFILLYDLPLRWALHRRQSSDIVATGSPPSPLWWLARLGAVVWFCVATTLLTAMLVGAQMLVAAQGVAAGIAVDPAAGLLSILAERIIHVGASLDAILHGFVDRIADRLAPAHAVVDGEVTAPASDSSLLPPDGPDDEFS